MINRFYVKKITSTSIRGYLLFGDNDEKKIPANFKVEESAYSSLLANVNKSIIRIIIDAGKVVGVGGVDEETINTSMSIEEHIETFIRENISVKKYELFEATKNIFPVSKKTVQRKMNDVINMNNDIIQNQMRVWVGKQ